MGGIRLDDPAFPNKSDEKACPMCAETVKAAAKVCRFCGHSFEKPKKGKPSPQSLSAGIRTGCLAVLGIFIVLAIISSFLNDTDPDPQSSSRTNSPGAATLETGDIVVLRWADSNTNGFLAVDDEAWDQMFEAINAKDEIGLQALVLNGAVYNVRSGTKARILDIAFANYKVRLQDGPNAGIAGWVVREFVQSD